MMNFNKGEGVLNNNVVLVLDGRKINVSNVENNGANLYGTVDLIHWEDRDDNTYKTKFGVYKESRVRFLTEHIQ